MKTTRRIAYAAVIAAIYAVITVVIRPLSYGPVQLRFAEALCLLPCLMPEGILGLTIGCLIANLFSTVPFDFLIGTSITLVAAVLTYLLRKRPYIAALPPIILNGFLLPISWVLFSVEGVTYWATCGSILISQAIVIYVIGLPLYYALRKPINKIYKG